MFWQGQDLSRKIPNPIDIHVGARMRMRRMLIGMSQEKLGESLGLTFQQVQKYEKGTNRIGASRLYQISKALDVPITFFYADLPDESGQHNAFSEGAERSEFDFNLITTSEGIQLNSAFFNIPNVLVRRRLLELMKALRREAEGDF